MNFSLTYGILHLIMVATSEKRIKGVEKQRTRGNYFLRVLHKMPSFSFFLNVELIECQALKNRRVASWMKLFSRVR